MKNYILSALSMLGFCLAQETPKADPFAPPEPIVLSQEEAEALLKENFPKYGESTPLAKFARPILQRTFSDSKFAIHFTHKIKDPIVRKRFPEHQIVCVEIALLPGENENHEHFSVAHLDYIIFSKDNEHTIIPRSGKYEKFLEVMKGSKITSTDDAIEIAQAHAVIFHTAYRTLIGAKQTGSEFQVMMASGKVENSKLKAKFTFDTDGQSKCIDYKVQHTNK